jgi:hypothetical protein
MKESGRPVHQFRVLNNKVGWDRYLLRDPMQRVYSDVVPMDRRDMQASGETPPWIMK